MAFYAYSDMFLEIADAAKQCGCKFTLYVDDMTFSSKEPFSPDRLRQMIDCILRKYGHKPKYSKVKYYGFLTTNQSPERLLLPNRLLPYQTVSKRPSTQRFRK